jgi:hypothetical protein
MAAADGFAIHIRLAARSCDRAHAELAFTEKERVGTRSRHANRSSPGICAKTCRASKFQTEISIMLFCLVVSLGEFSRNSS